MNTEFIQEKIDKRMLEANEILSKIRNNQSVSRYDVYNRRSEITRIMEGDEDYNDIYDEVYDYIESVKETL